MVNNLNSVIKKLMNFKYKKQAVIIMGIIGVLLILASEIIPKPNTESIEYQPDYASYVTDLENRTKKIISSIDGAGKCVVMITLEQTNENIYAQNAEETSQTGSISRKNEYVFYENNNNDEPLLIKQYFPRVYGVVVVCQGGDNNAVKERVISSISSLFDIPYTQISVSKLNR